MSTVPRGKFASTKKLFIQSKTGILLAILFLENDRATELNIRTSKGLLGTLIPWVTDSAKSF